VVENGVTQLPENPTEAQRTEHRALKKKDFKAIFFIHQCVDLINFQKIENGTYAKECWEILEKGYAGKTRKDLWPNLQYFENIASTNLRWVFFNTHTMLCWFLYIDDKDFFLEVCKKIGYSKLN
jgi:hypothetical protein